MERTALRPPTSERAPVGNDRRIRVLVADDNAGFRESVLALLDTDDLEVVGEAASGVEVLALTAAVEPDVVLMDVRMPVMDGIEATRCLKRLHPRVGVVALSGHEDQDVVREMLVAGASGYVLKDSDGEDILHAITHAALGGAVLSPEVAPRVIEELTEALDRERRRTAELEQAQEALLERSTRRHELVARLSHELRTPVTVILGMAQTLAKGTAEPDQRQDLLERLVERAKALGRLVERFELTVDAGLTELVQIGAMAREVAGKHARVTVEAVEPLPAVSLNPLAAARILDELVDNALRFSPDDSPVEVDVSLGLACVEVRVTDHGPGIDPADRDRIFAAFEQLEELNRRVHPGAGLGLSLARTAARAMGGDVDLERSGPEGSTFLWRIALDG
jgi:two-component system NarL family response regulator